MADDPVADTMARIAQSLDEADRLLAEASARLARLLARLPARPAEAR